MIVHIRITLFFQFSCSNSDEGTKSQDQLSYGTSVGRLGVSRGGGVSSVGRGVGLRLVGLVLLVGEGLVATGSRGGSTVLCNHSGARCSCGVSLHHIVAPVAIATTPDAGTQADEEEHHYQEPGIPVG